MANPDHVTIVRQGAEAISNWREKNPDERLDLWSADLRGADLSEANLSLAHLSEASLSEANLSGANLGGANLRDADLSDENLSDANLSGADLSEASLSGANLSSAAVAWTAFANVDISSTRGLDSIRHDGPSTIGVDTLYKSGGKIPEVFLRGCGVPDLPR